MSRGAAIAICAALLMNLGLLVWTASGIDVLVTSYLIQLLWTCAGVGLLSRKRRHFQDRILFYACAYAVGLMLFYFTAFLFLHRGILGEVPRTAAWATLIVVAAVAALSWIWQERAEVSFDPVRWNVVAILLVVVVVLSAVSSYGLNRWTRGDGTKVSDPTWLQTPGTPPNWGWQADRNVHFRRVTAPTYEEGFPPTRVNHRASHVTVVMITVTNGQMTKPRGFTAVKTLTASFFFILAYGLFAVSVYIAGLGVRLSTFVAVSALVFSPLKVPFLAPTPTYRGFFHAAGDLYHSDTHSTSMACSILGLFFILKAFQSRERTFLLGCALIAGAFFLKPAIFMVVAPAVYLFVAFCWRDFTVDRLLGLGVLLAVPIAWFGYIQFSAASANFDSFLPRSAEIAGGTSLTIEPRFFAGYLPKLKGRFPEWIAQSPVRTASAMTLLSFAAFWLAAASGIGQLWKVTRRGIRALKEHVRSNADTYFQLCFFLLAVMVAATLAARFNKNMNWKWSATAAYVLCLPLFVRGITLIKIAPLRWLSWALYALQTAQGVVYLWYYFWVGKVN